ncbi:MAG: LPS translocon maturation chaperone LptM [Pseudomonadota bacterium]
MRPLLLLATLLMVGCGQVGPLELPPESPPPAERATEQDSQG